MNDDVGGVAKRAVGLHGLTVSVRVPQLHNPGKEEKCTTEDTERHPKRVAGFLNEATPWHKSLLDPVLFQCNLALGESKVHRRRPGEEGKYGEESRMNRLQNSSDRRHDEDRMRHGLGNGRLNDNVGGMAQRAIGLNRLPVSVHVPNLHDPCKNQENAAEKAECNPQRMT